MSVGVVQAVLGILPRLGVHIDGLGCPHAKVPLEDDLCRRLQTVGRREALVPLARRPEVDVLVAVFLLQELLSGYDGRLLTRWVGTIGQGDGKVHNLFIFLTSSFML